MQLQVLWSQVVSFMEFKPNLLQRKYYLHGMGQLAARADMIFSQQPERDVCYGLLGGSSHLEIFEFKRNGSTRRTGIMDLSSEPGSTGLVLLTRFLLATPASLGYKAPVLPDR